MDRLLCHLRRSEASQQETGGRRCRKGEQVASAPILGLKFGGFGFNFEGLGPKFPLGQPKGGAGLRWVY